MYTAGGQSWGNSGWVAGDMYTVAGPATGGSTDAGASGDGGPATAALLSLPLSVAVDGVGNLYIADWLNNRVQEVPAASGVQFGQPMTKYDMYTIAGSAAGNSGDSADGSPATSALLDSPASVAVDAAGDVYFADDYNNRVQEVPAVSGTQWGQSMTASDMYTVAGSSTGSEGNSGDGGPATAALLNTPDGVSIDAAGSLYITGNSNSLREVVSATAATITPAPGQTSALAIAPGGAAPGGITVTQPGGAQVTFYAQTSGSCASPYVLDATGGQYCVLPQDTGATLTYSSADGGTYAFSPSPGSVTYTYSATTGNLTSETDTAGDTLTVAYQSPAPGSSTPAPFSVPCPSTATSCETITSASGRPLVIALNSSGLIASVTDPMDRTWAYGYNSVPDLTSVTDPMGNVTTYTYGPGAGNTSPLLASDLLTITGPNAQPGGPDAGVATVNAYNTAGQVTSQTDPMGLQDHVQLLRECRRRRLPGRRHRQRVRDRHRPRRQHHRLRLRPGHPGRPVRLDRYHAHLRDRRCPRHHRQ